MLVDVKKTFCYAVFISLSSNLEAHITAFQFKEELSVYY